MPQLREEPNVNFFYLIFGFRLNTGYPANYFFSQKKLLRKMHRRAFPPSVNQKQCSRAEKGIY